MANGKKVRSKGGKVEGAREAVKLKGERLRWKRLELGLEEKKKKLELELEKLRLKFEDRKLKKLEERKLKRMKV